MTRSWIGSLSKLTLAIVVAVAMSSAPLGCSQKKSHCGEHAKCMKDCDKCKDKAGCDCKKPCPHGGKDLSKPHPHKGKEGKKPCCPKKAMHQKGAVKKAEPEKEEGK